MGCLGISEEIFLLDFIFILGFESSRVEVVELVFWVFGKFLIIGELKKGKVFIVNLYFLKDNYCIFKK